MRRTSFPCLTTLPGTAGRQRYIYLSKVPTPQLTALTIRNWRTLTKLPPALLAPVSALQDLELRMLRSCPSHRPRFWCRERFRPTWSGSVTVGRFPARLICFPMLSPLIPIEATSFTPGISPGSGRLRFRRNEWPKCGTCCCVTLIWILVGKTFETPF